MECVLLMEPPWVPGRCGKEVSDLLEEKVFHITAELWLGLE